MPSFCPKCNTPTSDNWSVCPNCGTPLLKVGGHFCSKCGGSVQDDWNICPNCREPLRHAGVPLHPTAGSFPPADAGARGFLSRQDKDKFKLRAIILCVVFSIAYVVLPFVALIAMLFSTAFNGFGMEFIQPDRGALADDAIWYVEEDFRMALDMEDTVTLKKIDLFDLSEAEVVTELPINNPWLLPNADGLWIISRNAVGRYANNQLTVTDNALRLSEISSVFLHEGRPAAVTETFDGYSLQVYSGNRWERLCTYDISRLRSASSYDDQFQVISNGKQLHLFYSNHDHLYYRKGPCAGLIEDWEGWQFVTPVDTSWHAVWIDGEPAVFHVPPDDFPGEIEGLKMSGGRWSSFFTCDAGLAFEFGVYPLSQDGDFALLTQAFPGSTRLLIADGNQVIIDEQYGKPFIFTGDFMAIVVVFYGLQLLIPFLLAVFLSGLMRKYRKPEYVLANRSMPYASLTRRGLAQVVDLIMGGWMMGLGYLVLILSTTGIEALATADSSASPAGYGLMVGGMFWGIACLFVFSYTEGKWGVTPGKWALGIRVLGEDMQPCGFGRGLARNLLEIIDSFFNFLLGLMFVAFTRKQQRVGDIAARTVVVNVGNEAPRISG